MRVKSLQTKIDALLDRVVATDRRMQKKGIGHLPKHMEARKAVHDFIGDEIDHVRHCLLRDNA